MKLIDGQSIIEHAEVNGEDREFIRILMDYIEDADTVEPKQGEWIFKEITDDYHITGQCSVCKERRRIDNFCPNCGADMRGEK